MKLLNQKKFIQHLQNMVNVNVVFAHALLKIVTNMMYYGWIYCSTSAKFMIPWVFWPVFTFTRYKRKKLKLFECFSAGTRYQNDVIWMLERRQNVHTTSFWRIMPAGLSELIKRKIRKKNLHLHKYAKIYLNRCLTTFNLTNG